MSSPFFGLDIGASALRAAQQLLDTAAHNVANASTPGYTRQRVRVVAAPPYTYPAFNRTGLPGQIGTGVNVVAITRIRDNFLDLQVQTQLGLQGQWDARQQELNKIEAIFPEPSDSALGNTLSKYWDAWQDVAFDPTSTAARSALTEQAQALTSDINRDATQLGIIASGIDAQVGDKVQTINDLATQIATLNGQIQRVLVTGDNPNDLLDQREQLLEQLSAIVPVSVLTRSDGTINVLIGGTDLVNNVYTRQVSVQKDANGHAQPVWADGSPFAPSSGALKALVDVRDKDLASYQAQLNSLAAGIADATNALHERGVDATGNPGQALFTYQPGNPAGTLAVNQAIAADPRLLAVASSPNAPGDGSVAGLIADLRNALSYAAGDPASNVVGGSDLTTNGTARLMTLDASTATAQVWTFSSSGGNSLTLTGADGATQTIIVPDMTAGSTQVLSFDQLGIKLRISAPTVAKGGADLVTDLTTAGKNTITVASLYTPPQKTADFYSGLVGKIGSAASQAAQMGANQQLVVNQLQQRVEATSGVSLDEEASDMIRFQHAYQAAARVITTMDEMLNTLINNTGLVGR
jgi:flagellar hook-associated protein 1 FlgK